MRRYVGNLAARDGENRNLASYSFETAMTRNTPSHAVATETMKNQGLAAATLIVTENDNEIVRRDLTIPIENSQATYRPFAGDWTELRQPWRLTFF
jgi:hypothetical protein